MSNDTKKIKITLKRSLIGRPKTQKKIVESLGISKLNHSVELSESPAILGMIRKVSHLVSVE